jgi:hypothetical protein
MAGAIIVTGGGVAEPFAAARRLLCVLQNVRFTSGGGGGGDDDDDVIYDQVRGARGSGVCVVFTLQLVCMRMCVFCSRRRRCLRSGKRSTSHQHLIFPYHRHLVFMLMSEALYVSSAANDSPASPILVN